MSGFYTCCLCHKTFAGFGNNPDMWDDKIWKSTDRCCDNCNLFKVIPARLQAYKDNKIV